MKHKTIWIIALAAVLCLICNSALVTYGRSKVVQTGIKSFTNPKEIETAEITLDYVLTKNDEKYFFDSMESINSLCEALEQADAILLVASDGGVNQFEGAFAQTLTIRKVLWDSSNMLQNEDTIRLLRYWGMEYDGGYISLTVPDGLNILNEGNEYLVFLQSSPLNEVSGYRDYWLMDNTYSIINQNRNYADATCPSYDFNRCRELMHFTSSERIAAALAEQEDKILAYFLKE